MEDKYLDLYKEVKARDEEKKNDYLEVYDAAMSNSAKKIKIKKSKMISFKWERAAGIALTIAAIGGIYNFAVDTVQNILGSQYLVSQVRESGVLPMGFGSMPLSTGVTFNYMDADGNMQIASDSEAVVKDVSEDLLGAGFSIDQVAVYFDADHGWPGDSKIFEGSTYKGRIEVKKEAYKEMKALENNKGVSR